MDMEIAFLNFPLVQEVGVRFSTRDVHPGGHPFAELDRLMYGLKQAAADLYALQHARLLSFDPNLARSILTRASIIRCQ